MQCLSMERLHYYNLALAEIEKVTKLDHRPRLLMHVCCGPCSTFPVLFLCQYFDLTIYYNNSNIYPREEYDHRLQELQKYLEAIKHDYNYDVPCIVPTYDEESYVKNLIPLADCPEGGERCFLCYRLRMEEAYDYAESHGFDYFTTVMTISSQKNAVKLNEIGQELEQEHSHCRYFYSDFKKKKGADYGRELRKKYQLYQQPYCGCRFSYADYQKRLREKADSIPKDE